MQDDLPTPPALQKRSLSSKICTFLTSGTFHLLCIIALYILVIVIWVRTADNNDNQQSDIDLLKDQIREMQHQLLTEQGKMAVDEANIQP
eukprot:UN07657